MNRALLLALAMGSPVCAQMVPRLVLPHASEAADTFPMRRIALAAGQLPPASAGPLVALPLAEFEAKLQAASAAPPRILAATYQASLQGIDLVGEGALQITATAPTLIALEPLSIALAEPRWKSDDAAALDRTADGTRLWIDAGSGTDFLFRWSARGREEPGVLRYDLRLPAVAIAALELDLPAGRTVSAGDALVAGPLPSTKTNMSRWRLAFGGKSKLEITVANPTTTLIAANFKRNAKYDLTTGTATFDFDVEAMRGPVTVWTFRVDPEVRVLDVVTPNRDAWQFDSARRELTVTLREPTIHGHATIVTAVTIPHSGPPWACASVHGVGAAGDDAIELRVGADPRLEAWEPGDYTLSRIAPLADRGYLLALEGSWRTAATARKPPLLTLRPALPVAGTTISLDWQLSPTRNRVSARIRFVVQHGPLMQVAFKLPAGYTPGGVRFNPDDAAAVVNVNPAGTILTLEPSRPWSTGQTIEGRFELRGPPLEMGKPVPIPRLVPVGPTVLDGTLSVTLDPGLRFSDRAERTLQQPITSRDRAAMLEIVPASPSSPAPVHAATPVSTWDVTSSAAATIDDAGLIRLQLTGTVHRAGAAQLPIALPADAVLQGATVNGKYVEPAREGYLIRLPVNGTGASSFEVHYRRPVPLRAVVAERPNVAPRVLDQAVEVEWTQRGSYRSVLPGSATLIHSGAVAILSVLLFGLAIVLFRVASRLRRSWRAAPVAGLLLAGALSGQPAKVPTVYFRDADAMAFVSKEFFDRLDKLDDADRPLVAFTGAVVTGSADETHATFEIAIAAISRTEREQLVALPVQGIALESVTLDGAAAFPVATGSRFTLPVRGAGPHTIRVRGRVPLVVKGAERAAILPLDPLPMARLAMTLSPLARSIRVPNREGSFRSDRKLTGTTVEANLGTASPVVVRWRSGGLIDQPASMIAISATLWELAAGEADVTAAFSVRVEEGSLSRLAFEIPPNLEPGRLVIRAADGAAIGIRDGQLAVNANGSRTYTVQLQEPLEGANTIVLLLRSLAPLSATPQLTAVKLAAARDTDSYLLARVASPVDRWDRSGLAESAADAVSRDLGSVPELGLEQSALPVAYRRQGSAEAWLRPVIVPPSLPQPIAVDTAWLFGDTASLSATVRYARDANLAAVEFEVPAAVAVSDVVAPDLAGWSRTGNRVRVWFRSPHRELTLKWYGTWPMPTLPATIELPQPVRAVPHRIVRLRTEDKVAVQVVPGSGWRGAITLTPAEIALMAPTPATPLKIEIESR